jgi:transposase
MANTLKMEQILAIQGLHERGWSERRIARELGLHRNTVKRYTRAKCTNPQTGNVGAEGSKCTNVQTGKSGRRSGCEPHAELIKAKVLSGLSIERIHQDLRVETAYEGSYHSVWRFVESLGLSEEQRVYRMEVEPGQEAQVDYGTMYLLEGPSGRLRSVRLLLVTLSHSRKAYAEAMLNEQTESFIRGLENAFSHFGGVPLQLCPDNLPAAVKQADWFEPQLNPKLASFARHYGTLVMPSRPYRPTDKGKVEAGIKYLKNNALKGRRFKSLEQINEHLKWWMGQVADKRIHGTTKRQVQDHFLASEKAALKPLPAGLFPCFQEARRSVHRDSYVEVAKSYYEVPAEYIGKHVWVRWDSKTVRIFDKAMQQVSIHCRLEPGQFSRVLGAGGCAPNAAESLLYYRGRVARLGKAMAAWADGTIADNPERALRRLQGVLHLHQRHDCNAMETAAAKAVRHGHYQLHQLKHWLTSPREQEVFAFLEQHELIRQPALYTQLTGTGDLFDN